MNQVIRKPRILAGMLRRAAPAGGDDKWCPIHQHYKPCVHNAPAGSGEVVVPAIERMLVDAYAAGMNGDNFDMLAARRNLSALLRKLSKGESNG